MYFSAGPGNGRSSHAVVRMQHSEMVLSGNFQMHTSAWDGNELRAKLLVVETLRRPNPSDPTTPVGPH